MLKKSRHRLRILNSAIYAHYQYVVDKRQSLNMLHAPNQNCGLRPPVCASGAKSVRKVDRSNSLPCLPLPTGWAVVVSRRRRGNIARQLPVPFGLVRNTSELDDPRPLTIDVI